MKRRGFLAFLGIGAVALPAVKLRAAIPGDTHLVVATPNYQCGRCGDVMRFLPYGSRNEVLGLFQRREPARLECVTCHVVVDAPMIYSDATVKWREEWRA